MRSPEQQFAFAKTLPIPELAKVLQGQSDVVDMAIAQMVLREKTRAQKMQQGMAAQQMAQQPNVAEKDLMEAGVGALPADVDVPEMAGGGIVAFAAGDFVGPRPQSREAAAFRAQQAGLTPIGGPKASVPVRGMFGRMLGPLGAFGSMAYDELFGTSQDELNRLKAYEEAKDYLKQQGLTDKDIGNLSTEDIFGAAQAYGYRGQRGVPTAMAMKGQTAAEKALADQAAQIEAGQGPNAKAGIAALEGSAQSGRVPGLAPDTIAQLDALKKSEKEEAAGISELAKARANMQGLLKKPSLAESSAEIDRLYKEAGVTMDPYAEYKKDLEKQGAEDAEARKQAGWMRALEAGLGIMGGESPYALTNIGKGSEAAVKGYASDIKEFRKAAKERDRAKADIAAAENSLKKGVTDAKVARYDRAVEKYDAATMDIYKTDATIALKKMEYAATKGDKRMATALEAAQRALKALPDTTKMDPNFDEDAFIRDRAAQYLGFLQSGQFAQPSTAVPSGVKVTPKK